MSDHFTFRANSAHGEEILVGRGILGSESLEARFDKGIFVVDEIVNDLHRERIRSVISRLAREARVVEVHAGEAAKTLNNATRFLSDLLNLNPAKADCLVAIGGGTITDLTAFMAQLLFRGVPLILIPTTLLAQVDAAIGGKHGLNLNGKKNRIGSFYFPRWVVCDTSFIDTLVERDIRGGIAEMIKVFAVSDRQSFDELKMRGDISALDDWDRRDSLISSAVHAKVTLLADDPFEVCPGRLLHFGHVFAHSLEECSNFGLTHGEAVMLSMLCEAKMGQLAGFCTEKVFDEFYELVAANMTCACREFRVPMECLPLALTTTRELRGGHDHFVALSAIGAGTIVPEVDHSLAITAWKELSRRIVEMQS